MKVVPKQKESSVVYIRDEIKERTITDVTYKAMDIQLLKKYFPSIYKEVMQDKKLTKRTKGSKE
ncbi:hypothetical protein [Bacteroides thetaiotaomicron]|jgi:hypothetical protein|uniref:hypothetical protein n=1 Tax=Bacteroides thetaiotaomicron TaxID=818 RepID=UPI001F3F541C|nr:hypothetical protein [Bacteroides thetaiotaomicron]MCE8951558.1 hypothetical protein [Bacteroides thetaiotaomicron]MCE8969021.1 hypothetical protein [Bacteroides thetaiotaomicron]